MVNKSLKFEVSYDSEADAAYVYISKISGGEVVSTLTVDDNDLSEVINIDLSKDSRLLGVEILNASNVLPSALLDQLRSE